MALTVVAAPLASTAMPGGGSSGTALAADGPGGLAPVAPMRQAPRPRSEASAGASQSSAQLRWRPSSQVRSTTASRPEVRTARHDGTTADASPIQRVTYMQDSAPSAAGDPWDLPGGDGALPPRVDAPAAAHDPFLDPFGDSALEPAPAPTSRPLRSQSAAAQASPRLVQEGLSLPPLDGEAADDIEPLDLPAPEPVQDDPSPSTRSMPSLGAPQTSPSDLRPLPSGRQTPGGSQETEPTNPFPGPRGGTDGLQSNGIPSGSGMDARQLLRGEDCEEQLDRVRRATIQTISLDISPPFRPDITTEDAFRQARDEFLDDRSIRQWRSRAGRNLAEGRLVDLAFEMAIVETEQGVQLELPLADLSNADLAYVTEAWDLPFECQLPVVAAQPRRWLPIKMTWTASNLCHKPLYFQDVNLERYGHTAGPFAQPVISTAHFFVNIAVLPYKMGIHPPNECQYALGYYRPGNCAPWIIPPVPLSLRGALYQAGVVGGGIAIIP